MDLSLDGSYTLKGVHVGAHTLRGWLVRADHTKIAGTDAAAVHFSNVVDPADPVGPTVALTAPAAGDGLGGGRRHRVGYRRNRCLRRAVQLDGAPLGVEDIAAPYTVSWETTTTGNGPHVLTAVARDEAGNETNSAPVAVTVSNSGSDPAVVGSWSSPVTLPIVPVHTSMLPNGKLLIFDSETNSSTNPRVWDPVSNTFTQVPYNNVGEPLLRRPHAAPGRSGSSSRGVTSTPMSGSRTRRSSTRTNTWTNVQPMHYGAGIRR